MKNTDPSWNKIAKKLEVIKEVIYLINYLNTTIQDIRDTTEKDDIVSVLRERRSSLVSDLTHLTNVLKFNIERTVAKDTNPSTEDK